MASWGPLGVGAVPRYPQPKRKELSCPYSHPIPPFFPLIGHFPAQSSWEEFVSSDTQKGMAVTFSWWLVFFMT